MHGVASRFFEEELGLRAVGAGAEGAQIFCLPIIYHSHSAPKTGYLGAVEPLPPATLRGVDSAGLDSAAQAGHPVVIEPRSLIAFGTQTGKHTRVRARGLCSVTHHCSDLPGTHPPHPPLLTAPGR